MARLVAFLAVLGFAYWYWSGRSVQAPEATEADRLQENAAIMQHCIRQETRPQAVTSMAGVVDAGDPGPDAERLCAEKHGLQRVDGQWRGVDE